MRRRISETCEKGNLRNHRLVSTVCFFVRVAESGGAEMPLLNSEVFAWQGSNAQGAPLRRERRKVHRKITQNRYLRANHQSNEA